MEVACACCILESCRCCCSLLTSVFIILKTFYKIGVLLEIRGERRILMDSEIH